MVHYSSTLYCLCHDFMVVLWQYVGESERSVRQLFLRAKNAAPSVIFFDEIDAICPRRSESGDNNVTSRIVNQLLTELDGLEPRKQVFIIGATNRPGKWVDQWIDHLVFDVIFRNPIWVSNSGLCLNGSCMSHRGGVTRINRSKRSHYFGKFRKCSVVDVCLPSQCCTGASSS